MNKKELAKFTQEPKATRLAATLFVLIKCNKLRLHKVKYNRKEMKIGLVR